MRNIACNLLGHYRSIRRARRSAGTWRSKCHLCGTRMQRISPGRWLPVSELSKFRASGFAGMPAAAD